MLHYNHADLDRTVEILQPKGWRLQRSGDALRRITLPNGNRVTLYLAWGTRYSGTEEFKQASVIVNDPYPRPLAL